MDRGRPIKGPSMVEALEGTQEAKKRLRVILETIAGQRSVEDACRELGIEKSAFHKIRTKVMQAALEDLEPKTPGRKPTESTGSDEKLRDLEKELEATRLNLKMAHIREELLLGMPEVMEPLEKKKQMEARKRRRRKLKKKRQEKRRKS